MNRLVNVYLYLRLYFSATHIRGRILVWDTVRSFFSMLGGIWLVMRIMSLNPTVDEFLEDYATICFVSLLGLILTLVSRKPDVEITEQIRGLDAIIKIRVGDVMKMTEPCVISTNTTFDTAVGPVISKRSVQGQFTQKYYDHISHLDTDLENCLRGVNCDNLADQQTGETLKYPLGTVVTVNPKERTFYLLAMADINSYGNAVCDFKMVSDALNGLWQYLGESGDYERELLIPVLGTGHGRVREPRIEIIREIIDSFIAASTQRSFCDTLSIVIYSSDFYRFNLKMEDLKHYLSAQCRYSRIRRSPGNGTEEP